MESTVSSSGGSRDQELHPPLLPGFRFHPTDEELVVHYLKKKAASAPLPVAIIVDIDLYKFDPWELPEKASFGEQEWYFFSPRERKYPNGARPNRAATSGYWKATGTDKPILTSGGAQKVGVKKALVFYGGKPPRGIKTNWIMHEYRLTDGGSSSKTHSGDVLGKNKASLRLDDWVLCRIYKKNSSSSQRHMEEEQDKEYGPADDMLKALSLPLFSHHVATSRSNATLLQPHKPADGTAASYGALLGHDEHLYEGLLSIHPNHPVPHMALRKPRPESPLPQGSTGSELPLKRGLSSACWNEAECILPSSGKRFQNCSGDDDRVGDQDDGGGGGGHGIPSMMATLLNQMPQQGAPYNHHHHHSAVLSALGGEGVFRQPYQLHGVNWGS